MTAPGDLLTAAEVAPIVRLCTAVVLRKARAGEIESVQIGRKRLFRRSAVEAYLDRCTVSASAPLLPPDRSQRPSRNPDRRYKT